MKIILTLVVILFYLCENNYAQEGFGTELNGTFAIPTGKNAEYFNPGFGGTVNFFYDIEDNIRLALLIGYIHMGINEDKISQQLSSGGQQVSVNLSGGVGVIPILFSFKLITPAGKKMRFYGLVEGGLYTYRTSAEGNYTVGSQTTQINESEFRSEPGLALGMGVLFPIDDELSFDANIRYHFARDSEYLNLDYGNSASVSTSQMFTFGAGVNWFFPL